MQAFSGQVIYLSGKDKLMFRENDKVVYPGYGVATIDRIVTKNIAGKSAQFFELKFVNNDMTILVPVMQAESVGLRALSSHQQVNDLLDMLSESALTGKTREINVINWNKRNKEYQEKLRSGNLYEICSVYRDLKLMEQKKDLSFGEQRMLLTTEMIIVEELSLVTNVTKENMTGRLRKIVGATGLQREQQV